MKAIEELSSTIDLICQDLGIRETPPEVQKLRFIKLLGSHFGHITAANINEAFEMYLIGRFTVTSHYGVFSSEFFLSVIREYIKIKGKELLQVQSREQKSLPAGEDSRKEFLESIAASFNRYKATGDKNRLWLNWPVYNYWNKKGFVDANLTKEDEMRAKRDVLNHMADRNYSNLDPNLVKSETKAKAYERVILEFYDKLIKNDEQIRDYF